MTSGARAAVSSTTIATAAALGAAVTLQQGAEKSESEVGSGDGFISQSDLRLHLGLGAAG